VIELDKGVCYFAEQRILISWNRKRAWLFTHEFMQDIELLLVWNDISQSLYPIKSREGGLAPYAQRLAAIFDEFETVGTSTVILSASELTRWRLMIGF
jgi:hypothetical protein